MSLLATMKCRWARSSDLGNGTHQLRIEGTPCSAMTWYVCEWCGAREERGPGSFYREPVQAIPLDPSKEQWR
jgi:hypothetical protein